MIFKFKILYTSEESKIAESFGDVIKLKLHLSDNNESLIKQVSIFLANHLCISKTHIHVIDWNIKNNIITVDLPDNAYEIIMSWVTSR